MNLVLRPTFLFLCILFLVAGMSTILPGQAVAMNPKGECFEVTGTDPHGLNHETSFYHKWAAKNLAAAWITEGWTGVTVDPC
jgi:hypothetical protein